MNGIVEFFTAIFRDMGCTDTYAKTCASFSCAGIVIIGTLTLCICGAYVGIRIAAKKQTGEHHRQKTTASIKAGSSFLFFWICSSYLPKCFASHPDICGSLSKLLDVCAIAFGAVATSSLANWLHLAAHCTKAGKTLSSKTVIQVCKIIIWCTASIIIVSRIMDKSPAFVLSGLGAMTAVLMLVFRDSILGLVAGIQVSQNDMVRIGDWITMPKYNADGTVIDIALTTVKVQNFDNTVTMIPSSVLISDSFVNWRYMSDSKGRRIKRAVLISAATIRAADEPFVNRLIAEKLAEPGDKPISNLAAFETWIGRMLKRDERISNELTCMVRQTDSDDTGIPIEVYAFTKSRDWIEYEKTQSEIFDLIYITVPRFGLRIYQRTGDNGAPIADA